MHLHWHDCCCRVQLQVRKRKWENYSSGEELFGLAVTSYPELEQTEKEVSMLDRLYRWVCACASALQARQPHCSACVSVWQACIRMACSQAVW
jgi:hypothetical protein